MSRSHWFIRGSGLALASALLLGVGLYSRSLPSVAGPVQLPSRWLELRQVRGSVAYKRSGQERAARVGDRLQRQGEGLMTGNNAAAVLAIDDGITPIWVAANTDFQIQSLRTLSNGGKITVLSIRQGQVRFQPRKFTNPSSRLDVRTPAGVASVRGTEFGVNVKPDGTTGVAVRRGRVAVEAQQRTVLVNGGYGSLISPGETPTPPRRFAERPSLQLRSLVRQGSNQVRITAQTDPLNEVLFNDQPLNVRRDGNLDATVRIGTDDAINLIVRDPLGQVQPYQLALP